MRLKTTVRPALAHALGAVLFLALLVPISYGQQRKPRVRQLPPPPPVAQVRPPRRQPAGTAHRRPPRTYDVLGYTIRTRFDVPQKTVIGDETVTLKPLAAGLKSFELDASGMKIESVSLSETSAPLQWTQPPDKLSITLDRAYDPAETISVRIQYRARPERGIYFIPQTINGKWSKPAQIWTQGEPEENHYWFPCYDFPDDKATSEQYITTAANEIAISNGSLVETISNPDGTRTFHWKMEQPHGSYLISLVVGDYVRLADAYNNIPVEYYTYRGTETEAQQAFGRTPEMMRWFSQVLNYDYPYQRYAQVIVANFIFGGMENITATTQADTEILNHASKEEQGSVDNLVSHELAHSWFGNLVTCKDWSQAWLNEGFATFMEASYKEHERGRDAYLQEMRMNAMTYFMEDALKYRRPIVYDRYRAPIDLFDATLYKKGALIVHMLRETVGDDLFWKSLNRYLTENRLKSVETADLQRAFAETTGQNLDWFFDQWVYKAGFPELRVRSSYQAPSRVLTLEVEQTQTPDAFTPAVFRLPVEIEIATAGRERTERIEIRQRRQFFTFQLDGQPLMIRFDKGERILKKLDFPQPVAMLSYQLGHSSDAVGRIEAAEALAPLLGAARTARTKSRTPESVWSREINGTDDAAALNALRAAALTDSFPGVRRAAAKALDDAGYVQGANEPGDDARLLATATGWLRKVSGGKHKRQGQWASAPSAFDGIFP